MPIKRYTGHNRCEREFVSENKFKVDVGQLDDGQSAVRVACRRVDRRERIFRGSLTSVFFFAMKKSDYAFSGPQSRTCHTVSEIS